MPNEKEFYDDRAVLTGVTKAAERDINSYYAFDLESLYKLNETRRKKSCCPKEEEKPNVNSFIEEQLKTGVSEETVRQRVSSFMRTINHSRKVQKNNEEKEVFARLEKRLSFEEKEIEEEAVATLFKSIPGALPCGIPEESIDTCARVYAKTLLRAPKKERERFYAKLDDVLFARTMMLDAAIIFRKCLDIEATEMIANHASREEIERTLKQRIEERARSRKVPYSIETITKAKVLAKIDDLETGMETFVEEEDYVTVQERLKFIRMNIKAQRSARRLELTQNKK